MSRTPRSEKNVSADVSETKSAAPISSSRRSFLGKLGVATVAAGVAGSVPKAVASINPLKNVGTNLTSQQSNRGIVATAIRNAHTVSDSLVPVPPHTTNGDELRYSDKSASYGKALLQKQIRS